MDFENGLQFTLIIFAMRLMPTFGLVLVFLTNGWLYWCCSRMLCSRASLSYKTLIRQSIVVIMEIMIVLNVVSLFFFFHKEHNVDKLAHIDNQKFRLLTGEDIKVHVDRRLVEPTNWNELSTVSCKCSNERRLISSYNYQLQNKFHRFHKTSVFSSFWVVSIHLAVKNNVMGRCFIW